MSVREEYAAWARQVRERIDVRQQELELGLPTRQRIDLDGRQELAGEESQDPGGWDAA
ncbi:hypothetical protein GCM10009592_28990 [Brachybacterium rhamnosum]|uniref:Uncharacterized protein n=1 Tax=Brachybacterium rhamnosum TaxID=173361 RepID=A0ABW4Q213_9MICO